MACDKPIPQGKRVLAVKGDRSDMNKSVREKRQCTVPGEMERCVLCWGETDVPKDTPVNRRRYYLEGQGQLCAKCYYELYGAGVFRRTQDTE